MTTTTPPGATRQGASLLSVDAVAELTDLSAKTIRRRIKDGQLVAHRIGRLLRISQDDLRLFLSQRRGQGQS